MIKSILMFLYNITSGNTLGGEQMSESLIKDMGERIAVRRKSLGITQEVLAEKIDVSIQMISNLECGRKSVRLSNLVKVSDILDISIDYLLTGKHSDDDYTALTNKLKKLNNSDYSLIEAMIDYCINNR